MAVGKRNFKSLFTTEEVKETVQAIKVEQSKSEHSQETIQIPERPVICKKCHNEFLSTDVSLYQCFGRDDMCVAYCSKCTTANKIKKNLSFPERH